MKTCLAAVTLGIAMSVSAAPSGNDALPQKIKSVERAIVQSSVTERYSQEDRAKKLRLLTAATQHISDGEAEKALTLVEQSIRLLYPVANIDGDHYSEGWLRDIQQAMHVIIPVAKTIAVEKGRHSASLRVVAQQLTAAEKLLDEGGAAIAGPMLVDTYSIMQNIIAELREGDELMIPVATTDAAEAWEDAERRYSDWRFTADWMVAAASDMGADPTLIYESTVRAQGLFEEASRFADNNDFELALEKVEEVYQAMEAAWRAAGVDI